jgi:hypothetical protein
MSPLIPALKLMNLAQRLAMAAEERVVNVITDGTFGLAVGLTEIVWRRLMQSGGGPSQAWS